MINVLVFLGVADLRPKIYLVMTGCNGSAALYNSMQTHTSVLPGERLIPGLLILDNYMCRLC